MKKPHDEADETREYLRDEIRAKAEVDAPRQFQIADWLLAGAENIGRKEYLPEKTATARVPKGIYRIIYADPPRSYGSGCFAKRKIGGGAERHYQTMLLADICKMPLPAIAPNAVLFLWVPAPHLKNGLAVIDAWNFNYKTNFVWNKLRHNFGHYNSGRHELLLVGTRGNCLPDSKKLVNSVQSIERTEHSRKPELFRNIIDKLYPLGQRIELFARGRLPADWDGFGYEYEGPVRGPDTSAGLIGIRQPAELSTIGNPSLGVRDHSGKILLADASATTASRSMS